MTLSDRESFEEFLSTRVRASRAVWEAARKLRRLNLELAVDVPEPDGTLLRRQAMAFPELSAYLEALKDLTAMTCEGSWRPELLKAWSANRKPMGTAPAHPNGVERSSQDQPIQRNRA